MKKLTALPVLSGLTLCALAACNSQGPGNPVAYQPATADCSQTFRNDYASVESALSGTNDTQARTRIEAFSTKYSGVVCNTAIPDANHTFTIDGETPATKPVTLDANTLVVAWSDQLARMRIAAEAAPAQPAPTPTPASVVEAEPVATPTSTPDEVAAINAPIPSPVVVPSPEPIVEAPVAPNRVFVAPPTLPAATKETAIIAAPITAPAPAKAKTVAPAPAKTVAKAVTTPASTAAKTSAVTPSAPAVAAPPKVIVPYVNPAREVTVESLPHGVILSVIHATRFNELVNANESKVIQEGKIIPASAADRTKDQCTMAAQSKASYGFNRGLTMETQVRGRTLVGMSTDKFVGGTAAKTTVNLYCSKRSNPREPWKLKDLDHVFAGVANVGKMD